MYLNYSDRYYKLGLVMAIAGSFTFFSGCASAQVVNDNSLGIENTIISPKLINSQTVYQIDGGATRNSNLFHSFDQFSLPTGTTAYFNNSTNIQNIISRVTGNSISHIDGILKTNGNANLFLINPNGIIFGPNAALNIQGSFLASTASSLKFANNIEFSATNPQTVPLLAVNVPMGLQFGSTAADIRNQSRASLNGATNRLNAPAGLQVPSGKTLALVGGNLWLEGGNLTAKEGRIELGSVGSNSLVSINPVNQGWVLGYENVRDFQNIQLTQRTVGRSTIPSQVDVSGEGSGSINLQARQAIVNGRSRILANTLGSGQGSNLTINAAETVELIGFNAAILTTENLGSGKAGDLIITTGKLIVRNVAQVRTGTTGDNQSGLGGKLIINASDFVQLKDSIALGSTFIGSGLFSATSNQGDAGDIIINTKNLYMEDGATISAQSSGVINQLNSNQIITATGRAGNLTINVQDILSMRQNSLISTNAVIRDGGNIIINTKNLYMEDGATISANSSGLINPLNPNQIIAATGTAGNLTVNVQDILSMRRNSLISTNAVIRDGGNITINIPNGFIVGTPLTNSDITANAFSGGGGKININARGIFGFVPRTRNDLITLLGTENPQELNPSKLPSNDITAFSQQNASLKGIVNINTPDADPSKGLVSLQSNPLDASGQIRSSCNQGKNGERSSFTATGRGGVASSPTDQLIADAVLADWITLSLSTENRADIPQQQTQPVNHSDRSLPIIEAQGWIVDHNGNIVLVAQAPTVPYTPGLKPVSCGVLGSGE